MSADDEKILSAFWEEEEDPSDPFSAAACFCAGYNVYEDILPKASWIEYLFLLFKHERATRQQSRLLELLALAIANPGPRDHSVRAAMNGGVGGSTAASSLIAALAVGAGKLGGAREVFSAVTLWNTAETDIAQWADSLKAPVPDERADVWPDDEHVAGFNPHGVKISHSVIKTLTLMAETAPNGKLAWLKQHRDELEAMAGAPLAMTGLAACVLSELSFDPAEAEMLFLLLRLPGSAVHALEQKQYGWRRYPFFHEGIDLLNDPIKGSQDD